MLIDYGKKQSKNTQNVNVEIKWELQYFSTFLLWSAILIRWLTTSKACILKVIYTLTTETNGVCVYLKLWLELLVICKSRNLNPFDIRDRHALCDPCNRALTEQRSQPLLSASYNDNAMLICLFHGKKYKPIFFDIWQNCAHKHVHTQRQITTPTAVIKLIHFGFHKYDLWLLVVSRGGGIGEWGGSVGCWYMKWLGECSVFPLSCPLHCNYHSCSFCTTAPISPRHCNRDWLVRRPKQRSLKRHQTHIS